MSIIPSLGLIVINELDDFAENWIEAKIVSNSELNPQCDIRVLRRQVALAYWISNNEDWLHHGRLLRVHSVWLHPIAYANGRANRGALNVTLNLNQSAKMLGLPQCATDGALELTELF